jgi:hypothetical protein
MNFGEFISRLPHAIERGGQWSAKCPAHDDAHASLSIGEGSDGTILIRCHAGCTAKAIVAAMGLTLRDLFSPSTNGTDWGRIVKAYDYTDEQGRLLFQAVRFDPKDFRQRSPDGNGGWRWKTTGVRRVLYRLPTLRPAIDSGQTIFIAEGEKDVDTVVALGLTATCNVGGAGKWKPEYSGCLRGAKVIIIVDQDEPGKKHAAQVAKSLHGVAELVKVIDPPAGKDVTEWLQEHGGTKEKLLELAEGAQAWQGPASATPPQSQGPIEPDTRPEIEITVEEHICNKQAADALAADKTIFYRGPILVRIVRGCSKRDKRIKRDTDAPNIAEVPSAILSERLTSVAKFYIWKRARDGQINRTPAHPTGRLVQAVLERREWDGIRPLEGVTTAPMLRPDGTILEAPGYDEGTGLLYEPDVTLDPIPDHPPDEEIDAAVRLLLEAVCDFPFLTPAHRGAWMASLLTPLARHAFVGPAPLFAIDSNVRGAGKGLLASVNAGVLLGREISVMTAPREEVEFKKVITSIALAGDPLVLIDNVAGALGCPSLDAVLTCTTWQDRILGTNDMTAKLPMKTTWLCTGNNIEFLGDLPRRVCHIRLESKLENPEERPETEFKHPNLLAWVRENRGRLLRAALVILKGYYQFGQLDMELKPWGSFEEWSRLVRCAVVWSGRGCDQLADPGNTRYAVHERADQEAAGLPAILNGLEVLTTDQKYKQGVPASAIKDMLHDDHYREDDRVKALGEAILNLCTLSKDGGFPSPKSIGRKFRHLEGRVSQGKYLASHDPNKRGTWLWKVEPAG